MAAGNTTMELLERSPGVIVDKDGNISLRGKSGAAIMIDGKISYLSGADLANYLKNLPADQVSQLEIMANPSSRYDAAGTGGIINIKLKKNSNIGLNGSANATLAQGVYSRQSTGVNLNYRKNGWNWFGNGSVVNRKMLERNNLTRYFRAQNEVWENGFAFKNEKWRQYLTTHSHCCSKCCPLHFRVRRSCVNCLHSFLVPRAFVVV